MTDYRLLIWLTQLGLGVALPLGGAVWLSLWLKARFALGTWVVLVGTLLGALIAGYNLYGNLKVMAQMAKSKKADAPPPPVSFNNHE